MFGKKESKTSVGVVNVGEKRGRFDGMETVIGNNTIIKGEIDSTGTVRIDGRVEGKIKTDGDVIIGGDGEVKADIFSKNVVIGGKVEGNIEAKDRLEVSSTGKLVGNIRANSLKIDEGAVFIGKSEMLKEEVKEIEEVPDSEELQQEEY